MSTPPSPFVLFSLRHRHASLVVGKQGLYGICLRPLACPCSSLSHLVPYNHDSWRLQPLTSCLSFSMAMEQQQAEKDCKKYLYALKWHCICARPFIIISSYIITAKFSQISIAKMTQDTGVTVDLSSLLTSKPLEEELTMQRQQPRAWPASSETPSAVLRTPSYVSFFSSSLR